MGLYLNPGMGTHGRYPKEPGYGRKSGLYLNPGMGTHGRHPKEPGYGRKSGLYLNPGMGPHGRYPKEPSYGKQKENSIPTLDEGRIDRIATNQVRRKAIPENG